MKKDFVKPDFLGIIMYIVCIILLFMILLTVTSCGSEAKYGRLTNTKNCADSTYIVKIIDETLNPTFNNVQEICKYRERSIEEYCMDSIFVHMPNETFINVATVVSNRDGLLTKDAIITEYLHGKSIYNNLERRQVPKDSIYKKSTVDTIINGKHFQLIEKGETNVK